MADNETSSVTFAVTDIEPIRKGTLRAIATVELNFDGVPVISHGWKVDVRNYHAIVTPPSWVHPKSGKLCPVMVLPDELNAAITQAIFVAAGFSDALVAAA